MVLSFGRKPQGGSRRSPGGYVVEESLAVAGLDDISSHVALVETVRPKLKPYRVVLCQNAWNFIPWRQFRELLRPYPARSKLKYLARRVVATVNVRRAHRVVCLSRYMQSLVARQTDAVATVRVRGPIDLGCREATVITDLEAEEELWLIPGTVTWYKDPRMALRLGILARELGRDPVLVFAGNDDGSGCQQDLERALRRAEVRHRIGGVTRNEMLWLLENARITVIPSKLESLSLSFSEASLLSRALCARPLPVHLELSESLGWQAQIWLPADPTSAFVESLYASSDSVQVNADTSGLGDWMTVASLMSASDPGGPRGKRGRAT